MTGIETKLEFLQELEKVVLKALQAMTDVNDLVGFGIDNGLDCGFGGDIDFAIKLEEDLVKLNKLIESEISEQYDPEFEADRKAYIATVNEAYSSAKSGSDYKFNFDFKKGK